MPKLGCRVSNWSSLENARVEGKKVHNQLAAFEELTPEDKIIAFVDADIICPKDWLSKLADPINRGTHDPATTYRWLVPKKRRVASLYASVINASITTQGGNTRDNMPWGGSMAISRGAFDDLDVPGLFAGSLNDDLRLGKAAKRAGFKVGYIRNLVRPTEIDFNWRRFIEFARRQYLQVKVFAPITYCAGNLILFLYFIGLATVVAAIAKGYLWAWVPLILAASLDQIRAMTRESIYRNLFGDDKATYKKIARTGVIEHLFTPVYMCLHGLLVMSTWFMNKMEWGGIKYQVESPEKTRVLGRREIEATALPPETVGNLSVPGGATFAGLAAIGTAAAVAAEKGDTVTVDETSPIDVTEAAPVVDPTEPISVSGTADVVEQEEAFENENESAGDWQFTDSVSSGDDLLAMAPGACDFVLPPEMLAALGSEPGAHEAEVDIVDEVEENLIPGATEFVVPVSEVTDELENIEEIEEAVEAEEPVIESSPASVRNPATIFRANALPLNKTRLPHTLVKKQFRQNSVVHAQRQRPHRQRIAQSREGHRYQLIRRLMR